MRSANVGYVVVLSKLASIRGYNLLNSIGGQILFGKQERNPTYILFE